MAKKAKNWVVLRINSKGEVSALCEASFNMFWSKTNAYVYTQATKVPSHSGGSLTKYKQNHYNHIYENITHYRKLYKNDNIFLSRLDSKNCPIKIHWKHWYKKWNNLRGRMLKSEYRNKEFSVKDIELRRPKPPQFET